MTAPYLGNPKKTIEVLQKYDFVFQKKYGQNFLIDTHVLDKIINAAEITEEDFVLEIGPGIGTMTQYLASRAREVFAVEIDRALIPILEDTLSDFKNVTILNEDILKVDIRKLAEEHNQGIIFFASTDWCLTPRRTQGTMSSTARFPPIPRDIRRTPESSAITTPG